MHKWSKIAAGTLLVGLAVVAALIWRTARGPLGLPEHGTGQEGQRSVGGDGGGPVRLGAVDAAEMRSDPRPSVIEEEGGDLDIEFEEDEGGGGASVAVPELPPRMTLEVEVVAGGSGNRVPAEPKLLKRAGEGGDLAMVKATVESRGLGLYSITYAADAEPEWLVADARGAGVGSLPLEDAVLANQADRPARVTVRGAGRIVGRVVDSQGDPVAGIRLCAIQKGSNEQAPFEETGYPVRYQRLVDGKGRGFARFYTDEEGRFGMEGLREGSFVIVGGLALPEYLAQREPLGRVIARSDPVPVLLRLTEPEIMVRVATPTPVGAPAVDEPDGRSHWSSIQVEVYDLGPAAGEATAGSFKASWEPRKLKGLLGNHSAHVVEGRYIFHVAAEAGRRYAVRARQDERTTPIQTVVARRGGRQVTANLSIPEKPELARLRVDVDFAPAQDEHPDAVNSARVWLEDPDTGIALWAKKTWASDSKSAFLAAPLGRVRVVAEGIHTGHYPEGYMAARRRHGRGSAVIEVASGVDAQVKLPLPLGGAVSVTASAPGSIPGSTQSRIRFKIKMQAEGSADAEDLVRLFRAKDGGYLEDRHWRLGADMVSERLPAGSYRVTASFGRWSAAPQTIEIKAGSVVDLDLVLE